MRVRPTCDVATLADHVRSLGGERPRVAIEGEPYARTALLARCLQERVPGLTDADADTEPDADPGVRIWMEDSGGLHAHMLEEQARGTWVPGTCVTERRHGRMHRYYVEGHYEIRTDRVWVAYDRHHRHDRRDYGYNRHDRRHRDYRR